MVTAASFQAKSHTVAAFLVTNYMVVSAAMFSGYCCHINMVEMQHVLKRW